jgi:hypothetical protein
MKLAIEVHFTEVCLKCACQTHRALTVILFALLTLTALAGAQTWTNLTNSPPNSVGSPLLLTDGTVILQEIHTDGSGTGVWYRLTPDNTGSYVNGTWSQIASMPAGYDPEYYASAVLPDGRAIVEGGEYNGSSQDWTTLGAIYNPATNSWTSVAPPSGWSTIGDAPSVVLPNGTFMLGNCCGTQAALLNANNLTWTSTGTGKVDSNNEEGWTLLPNNDVLTVDSADAPHSELYNPTTQQWTSAGNTPVSLVALCELGPAVLRPDGTVIAFGADGSNAIYNSTTGTWSTAPSFPSGSGMAVADGPAALLPDGNVLVHASGEPTGTCTAPHYATGSNIYEFNGSSFTEVGTFDTWSYAGRMLVLPTGQILWTNSRIGYAPNVQIYTPSGTYQSAWQPAITSVANILTVGSTNNVIEGTQFNGLSQGAMYGDDQQMATNYPLVRIENTNSGHVLYAKTHNHSTMAVATGSAVVSTQFDVPSSIEAGPSTLVVVANGIPSNPASITITTNPNGATGSVAISGGERTGQFCYYEGCFEMWDCGTVSLTVNGHTDSAEYGLDSRGQPACDQSFSDPSYDNAGTVAVRLVAAINADSSSPVTANASGGTVNLTTKASGPGSDYSFSTSSVTAGPPSVFPSGSTSFPMSPASGKLTGGK